jgi:hypothetical protein
VDDLIEPVAWSSFSFGRWLHVHLTANAQFTDNVKIMSKVVDETAPGTLGTNLCGTPNPIPTEFDTR